MSGNEEMDKQANADRDARPRPAKTSRERVDQGALLALLRLLTREPPPGHDFKTCPICKRFGITEI